jgi:hypothetical protein
MTTVLFWNLSKRQDVMGHVICLAQSHPVDVFILAECPRSVKPVLRALNTLGSGDYHEAMNAKAKVRAITRLGTRDFIHKYTSLGREMAVWSLRTASTGLSTALIAGVHLPSKAGGIRDTDQASIAKEVIEELNDIEDDHKHRNTILVGDFNMNPYDPGMTSVTGVFGMMTTKLAELPDRRHRHIPRRRFYNPMWGLFGDRTEGPAGSHYWRASALHNPYWGILDQVLVRPTLVNRFNDLRILDHDGTHSLVSADGAPDRKYLSDHLPLVFRLDV